MERTETIYGDSCRLIDYYIQIIDALKELVTSSFLFFVFWFVLLIFHHSSPFVSLYKAIISS